MDFLYQPYVFVTAPIAYILYILNSVNNSHLKYEDSSTSNNTLSTNVTCVNIINFVRGYNIAQIVLCSYMTYGLMSVVSQGVYNPLGINTPYSSELEWFVTIHYLSKFFDWVDTYIIIKRGKTNQLSFLHVYHHSSIIFVWGYMLYSGQGNGVVAFGAWINSLTHVLMYSHYLLTSFKIKNPFKKYLTLWQITQFYLCFTQGLLLLFIYPSWETYLPKNYTWIALTYHTSLITLFSRYMNYIPEVFKMKQP